MTKTAVLIHGYTLKALNAPGRRNWKYVVFGNEDLHGRVPTGLRIAKEFAANLVIFGTGASCISEGEIFSRKEFYDLPEEKKVVTWESEYTWSKVFLSDNPELLPLPFNPPALDAKSANTAEEISIALGICAEYNITRLFLVTNPSHLPCCVREANKLRSPIIDVFGVACGTDFADDGEEAFIAEPFSGGGEKPKFNLNQILPDIFNIPPVFKKGFAQNLQELIQRNK